MDFPIVTVRAEITESFKNMACSKYQPVPLVIHKQILVIHKPTLNIILLNNIHLNSHLFTLVTFYTKRN